MVLLAFATAAAAAPLTTRPPLILHSLSLDVLGGGKVTRDPDVPDYPAGNPVQLTAVPDSGWIFAGWSGGATGTTNPLRVTMDADRVIGATFTAVVWTITASAGSGGRISPGGLVPVSYGADQTFTITPLSGYHVVAVRVDGIAVGPVTSYTFLHVTADHTITAGFAVTTHTMTVKVVGVGSVTRSPNLAAYAEGSIVSLKATPGVGWLFDRWSGDTSGTANPVAVTMSVDRTVTASFRTDWTITASAGSGGTISPNGPVVVAPGGTQAFVITPDPGYQVADVEVDGASAGAVTGYTFTGVSTDHTIAARFSGTDYALTVGVVGHGRVTRDPELARYPEGSTVTLTAFPDPGSTFAAWGGDAAGNPNPLTVTMDAAKSVSAGFDVTDILASTAATFPSYAGGLPPAWGDDDNDGDPDLPLVRNDGHGVFSEMPGFRTLLANGNYHGGAWCDFDRDGNLDLALQPYGSGTRARLLKNQGDGTFVDMAPTLGMDIAGYGATAVWGDFDGDGWVDLFTPYYSYTKPNRSYLWHNNGNGTFTDVGVESGVELSNLPAGLNPEGACAGDFDDDGDLDLYCAGHLLRNDGTGHFADVRAAMGLPLVSDGAARWVDYDDDGDLDLSLRTAAGPQLFRNDGNQFNVGGQLGGRGQRRGPGPLPVAVQPAGAALPEPGERDIRPGPDVRPRRQLGADGLGGRRRRRGHGPARGGGGPTPAAEHAGEPAGVRGQLAQGHGAGFGG
ncbi:MAG: VCBS repeat-containing protein, partial [Candidatus Eisenbacteria bacterium]